MPTKPTVRAAIAAFFAILGPFTAGRAAAQNVVLSEVCADGGDRWVELYNRGSQFADLSSWSLLHAANTGSLVMDYWWQFPTGTILAPHSFLRVHWYQNHPGLAAPGELYTGTSPYGFLFGLGGVPLDGTRGAVGLLSSQLSPEMNTSTVFVDWVSWGAHGFPRENYAVQNGAWTNNTHCASIPAGASLARNINAIGNFTSQDLEWFVDGTPTPNASNIGNIVVASYGQACTVLGHHLLGAPQLRTTSLPMLGNAQFGYAIDSTTGVYGECVLFAFSTAAAPTGLPSLLPVLPGSSCQEAIDTRFVVATRILATHAVETRVPLSLANVSPALSGLELHTQALVFDWLPNAWPPFQGITNAQRVVIGQ